MLRWVALAGLVCAVLLASGFVRFVIPPPADNNTATTDAIVVLTGGSLRLKTGIELMRQGLGRILFVSGVNRRVHLDELLRSAGEDSPPWLVCCTVLGHDAGNTAGNAAETALWMRRQRLHSLRLVTAWYHMPRSLLEFERAMPGLEIIPHPVFSGEIAVPTWLARHGSLGMLIVEYAKYLAALLFPVLDRPVVAGSPRTAAAPGAEP